MGNLMLGLENSRRSCVGIPIEKDSGVVFEKCIFAVVSTRFSGQLTGGARAQQPEMELS